MAMRCPFLREEQVKSCRAVPFRKPLARTALKGADERCSSPGHVRCPAAPPSREAHPAPSRCPFLLESLVQFCAASPVPLYVPWSESPDLRCGHDGHRFCELFRGVAGAGGRGPARDRSSDARIVDVAGVPMPAWLFYAPNHFWLDVGEDGLAHVGIDAFVTNLVGSIDRLTFLTLKGTVRPAVVLSVNGVDLTLAFAKPMHLVAVNTRLRANPDRLTVDPYGLGWLFEARVGEAPHDPLFEGLLEGDIARAWMAQEVGRASRFVHEQVAPRSPLGTLLADGGGLAPAAVRHLDRDQTLFLFAELFPLPLETRRPS
jgi:glycine cleavage system H lipoate-binding protein